jgi:hypothetical protein
MKPITPGEIVHEKAFPSYVIRAFNELIQENYRGRESKVLQDDVIERILSYANVGAKPEEPILTRAQIFELDYLDIEDMYKEAGWKVDYRKPDYNENPFPSYFRFKK